MSSAARHPLWNSRRLWSLWDMINFNCFGFYEALKIAYCTAQTATVAGSKVVGVPVPPLVPDVEQDCIKGNFKFIVCMCNPLLLERTNSRLQRIAATLSRQFTYAEVASEFATLIEAIEDDLRYELFYHYRKDKGLLVHQIQGDWSFTLSSFPSANKDIEDAVDCYATEHETACVFHLMRILEHGLRELSASVNVTFDIQNWHNVIDEIENQIRWFSDKFPRGVQKNEWIQFYSEAARHFFFLKEAWRNHVAHNRAKYDETSAKGIIEHVRDFMNRPFNSEVQRADFWR